MSDLSALPLQPADDALPSPSRRLLIKAAWTAPVILAVGQLPGRSAAGSTISPEDEAHRELLERHREFFPEN